MTPQEMQHLAELLQTVPGIKSLDLKDVRRLAQLLRESPEIGSIEVKGWFGTGIVITRTSTAVVAAPTTDPVSGTVSLGPPAAVAHRATDQAGPGAAHAAPAGLKEIRSPMVGTFFRSPEPGADPYAQVGTRITAGQTVCIIEAMKIMNEIEAEIAGVVREVCVEDAQPVEYGQVLFRVDPNG
ncbi:MAG TPA: acetyl-CoA carboxylase biotin carboxyl carrier protein [Gemmatimonadales bacterium]|jgi:acetyl-CoA carboxylase biotin carboxyl carrier protein